MSQRSDGDPLDEDFRRVFSRATADVAPPPGIADGVRRAAAAERARSAPRLPAMTAALSVVVVVALLGGFFLVLHGQRGGSGDSGPRTGATDASIAPFTVSSVNVAVTPISLAGMACGSKAIFAYTATFHMPANTAGGVIQFTYTAHGGQMEASPTGSLQVAPGQTSATINWADSGSLPADNTWPPSVQVMVFAPNHVTSNTARPGGTCGQSGAVPFEVTDVGVAVSPESLSGMACGSALTETYTATFSLAANGPGGTLQFAYTTDNGRSSTPATLTVAPGQTTATYQFQWSGALAADHTAPGNGGVMVSAPNAVTSPLVGPAGACS